jgi:hypothetical protein
LKHIKQRNEREQAAGLAKVQGSGLSAYFSHYRRNAIFSLLSRRAPGMRALRMDTLQGDGMLLHDFQMISHINQLSGLAAIIYWADLFARALNSLFGCDFSSRFTDQLFPFLSVLAG